MARLLLRYPDGAIGSRGLHEQRSRLPCKASFRYSMAFYLGVIRVYPRTASHRTEFADHRKHHTMMRSHYCGQLNESLADQEVTLCGWVHRRRDHGGVIFLDIRDRDGLAQVVFDPDRADTFAKADRARSEYVVKVTGKVRLRPEGARNPNIREMFHNNRPLQTRRHRQK